MKIITFDFDNTIAMSYMDTREEPPKPVFQRYNLKMVERIKKAIEEEHQVYIVTARKQDMEQYFPKQSIPFHLNQLGLSDYFLPDRLFYTNGGPKRDMLEKLKTELHYDDDIEEQKTALDGQYIVKQPLEDFEDGTDVGKTVIFDAEQNILILQRADEGHFWDLPGGHIKKIEVARIPNGTQDGTEREIFEETGLLVPFLKPLMVYNFNHKGKDHKINVFITKISEIKPHIRLDLQDHIENIDYKWLKLEELEPLLGKSTMNLRKSFDNLTIMDDILQEEEVIQLKYAKNHQYKKRRLIGYGKNKSFGGGKGHSRPKMSRSKSAPPIGEAKMPENDEKPKKKVKIKIKFIKNIDEKRKKRKKKKKKARKSHKKRAKFAYSGSYFPYYDMYDGGSSGDSGGDGGGGGE